MNRAVLINAALFALQQAEQYKGKVGEFLLDALFFSHVKTKHPEIKRQFHTTKKKKSPRIDFIYKDGHKNRTVIELAHRKRGTNVGYSPSANRSELKKLRAQASMKWRYLLMLDRNDEPLDAKHLKSLYDNFSLQGRPPKGCKRVTVVYVHKSVTEWKKATCFQWPPL